MWTKGLIVLSAALMLGAAAHAAEKPGKPLNIKPSAAAQPSGEPLGADVRGSRVVRRGRTHWSKVVDGRRWAASPPGCKPATSA